MSHILKNPPCPATQVMGKDQDIMERTSLKLISSNPWKLPRTAWQDPGMPAYSPSSFLSLMLFFQAPCLLKDQALFHRPVWFLQESLSPRALKLSVWFPMPVWQNFSLIYQILEYILWFLYHNYNKIFFV